MSINPQIKTALVVLSPDLIEPDKPAESALIRRAVSLAKRTGCELDLLHICYDSVLDSSILASGQDLQRERERLADADATLLAELAARISARGVNVRHEVRWDHPRIDAILRKVADSKPDIVLKQAKEHSYVLGMATNTDWELARRSPADVWLVSDAVENIDQIVAAVGNRFGDPADITTAADYNLLRATGEIGLSFEADVYPVNAYQVPTTSAFVTDIAGPLDVSAKVQEQSRRQTVRQHSGMVKALARYFRIPDDNVYVREGHASKVIPEVVDAVNADLVAMGATNIGRLERLFSPVTVEPVMAETDCDVLIVRDGDDSTVPDVAATAAFGTAKIDLQEAVSNPQNAFDSPQDVANLDAVSVEFRNRILQAWEYDIRAEMTDENEGGVVREIDVSTLDDVLSAKAALEMKQAEAANQAARLSGANG